MSLRTTWGYTINADTLAEMLTPIEFDNLTGNKYLGDGRIAPNIAAACSAIRNFCGWHIFPYVECSFSEYMLHGNGRIKPVGGDLLVQLPAAYTTDIVAVDIDGESFADYALEDNGLLYLFDVRRSFTGRKSKVTVQYHAGLPDEMMNGIKELIAHRVTHALASSAGVQSETAGGVSITYSANWINSSRATALADDNKEVLEPYRVRGVY